MSVTSSSETVGGKNINSRFEQRQRNGLLGLAVTSESYNVGWRSAHRSKQAVYGTGKKHVHLKLSGRVAHNVK